MNYFEGTVDKLSQTKRKISRTPRLIAYPVKVARNDYITRGITLWKGISNSAKLHYDGVRGRNTKIDFDATK